MEVMLVLVILGILGSMAAMFVQSARKDALRKSTKAEIDVLVSAIDRYSMNMLADPLPQDGLQALLTKPSSDTSNRWAGPYIKPNNDLKDAWGNDFIYEQEDLGNGNFGFVIKSPGPDGSVGNMDDVTSNDQF
jgi:general secretion pathway protein G